MKRRGYKPAKEWESPLYRGNHCSRYESLGTVPLTVPIYPEHNEDYLRECLNNLKNKNVLIEL